MWVRPIIVRWLLHQNQVHSLEVKVGESDVLHKLRHGCEPKDVYKGLDRG